MAQYDLTLLMDGPRNAVVHVAIVGDGSGDLVDAVLLDPATSFDPELPARPTLTIERILGDLAGFDGLLEFDHLVSDTFAWSMTGDQTFCADFTPFGGIKDRSPVLDGTGKLTLTTSGLGAGEKGSLLIHVRKD